MATPTAPRADWVSDNLSREWAGPEARRPLTPVILVIIGVMVASAVFWVGFMLAPAAVLLVGYLALSAGDRAQRQRLAAPRAAAAKFAADAAQHADMAQHNPADAAQHKPEQTSEEPS